MEITIETNAGAISFSDRGPVRSEDKAKCRVVYRALRNAQPESFAHNFSRVGRLDDQFVVQLVEPQWTENGYVLIEELTAADEAVLIAYGFRAAPLPSLAR